ncbi:Phosphoenolpyruvate-dependent phosphotransferase system [BD1-7 clade bacterium]|uniref:phosphoenolpyruvate--protein phosphotransferase n=1 Tax=BD1-7 clade bacterium TaxID=2029982 RepID=A0A5S9QCP5_9GAMM|nr:Phosphoenolpyruvate-dependent phosphotransferase system [BD1-7 clade bacterium]
MLDHLRQIVQDVSAAKDIQSTLDIIVARVKDAMQTEVCTVYLYDKNTDRYVFMATEGLNKQAQGRLSLTRDQGLVGLVASREEPINLDDAASHRAYKLLPDIGEEEFNAFLGTPIIHHREVLGVLVVQQRQRRKFDESEEAFLITVAAQLAGVIAHAKVVGAITPFERTGNQQNNDVRFRGIACANGIGMAEAVIINPSADLTAIPERRCENPEQEIAFFHKSLATVKTDMQSLRDRFAERLAKQETALFDVYLQMLDDNALGGEIEVRIEQGLSAASAVSEVVLSHIATFEGMDDPYLRERAIDIKDLGQRLMAYLQRVEHQHYDFESPRILIAEELTASILAEVPKGMLAGIATVRGTSNSHVAILARSMGIPTVMGLKSLPLKKLHEKALIIDGYNGELIANASDATCQRYENFQQEERLVDRGLEQYKDLPCKTTDGQEISLQVNAGIISDAERALSLGAEGVGLYRTEIQFLISERFPSEEEQRVAYRRQLEAFHPRPVTMRCLDIGGDKALPYFPIEESNPFLGWRGMRVTLDHPEIFIVQIRAMLKANANLGNLQILLPMVTQLSELGDARNLIMRAHSELVQEIPNLPLPKIGVMVEVPSAVYQIDTFARCCDFISLGSNDLTQYLLAVDRNNPRVSTLYNHYHPAVLQACYQVAQACNHAEIPSSICGELAADPAAAVLLMAMGFNSLSMSSSNLLRVKSLLRFITMDDAKRLLRGVLKLDNAQDIQDYLQRNLEDIAITPLFQGVREQSK